jgi:mannose-6-phosphate isomerase
LWQAGLSEQSGFRPQHGFPWLIKWLDIEDRLSVQVHPDVDHAVKWLGEACPKSEAWVVVHAEPSARVYAGFRDGVTPSDVRSAIEHGVLAECLHSFAPHPGDRINLPAGTVHAAGGGLVLAEVQQPSDATFRLFDWNRVGSDGQPRKLHIEQGLDCIAWPQGPIAPVEQSSRLLVTAFCELETVQFSGAYAHQEDRLAVWMILDGRAELQWEGGARSLSRGATILTPPGTPCTWTAADAMVQLLLIRPPRG